MREELLAKLRGIQTEQKIGELKKASDDQVLKEWMQHGVKFAASSDKIENVYYEALRKLLDCVVPTLGDKPILHEGGIYLGCWLESTGQLTPNCSRGSLRPFRKRRMKCLLTTSVRMV